MLKINDTALGSSTKNTIKQKFQIQRHDKQLHDAKPLDNNGTTKPFIKGLFLHVGIIGVIILGSLISNIGNPNSMIETSLISSSELAGVENQIAESRKQAKKAGTMGQNSAKSTTQMANVNKAMTTTNAVNNETETGIKKFAKSVTEIFSGKDNSSENETIIIEEIKTQVEEKSKSLTEAINRKDEYEVQYEKDLKAFVKEEQEKARKAEIEAKERQIIEEKALIKAFRESEQNIDNVVQKKKKSQKEIEEQREEDLARQQANEKILAEQQGQYGTGDASGFEPVKSMSLGIPDGEEGTSKGKKNALQAVANKIMRLLIPPAHSGFYTSEARITVNARGEVIRVIATGKNVYLNKAVEQAVMRASPLPITANDRHYPIFSIEFQGRGEKDN